MKRKNQDYKRDTFYWSLFCSGIFLLGVGILCISIYRNKTLPEKLELQRVEVQLLSVNEIWSYTSGTRYELQDTNGTEYIIPGYMSFVGTDTFYEKGRVLADALCDNKPFTLLLQQRTGRTPIVWGISTSDHRIMTYEEARNDEIANNHLGYLLGTIFIISAVCVESLWCILEKRRLKRQQRARQRRLEAKKRRRDKGGPKF